MCQLLQLTEMFKLFTEECVRNWISWQVLILLIAYVSCLSLCTSRSLLSVVETKTNFWPQNLSLYVRLFLIEIPPLIENISQISYFSNQIQRSSIFALTNPKPYFQYCLPIAGCHFQLVSKSTTHFELWFYEVTACLLNNHPVLRENYQNLFVFFHINPNHTVVKRPCNYVQKNSDGY